MNFRQQATLFCSLFLIGSAEVVASPMMAQMGRSFGVVSSQIAYLPAAYGLAYGPVALLAGPLSDRWGRKRPLQLGLLGFALLCALMPSATSLQMAVCIAALTGICAAVIQPNSLSIVGDETPPEDVAKRLGHALAGLMLAFVLTPVLAGGLADALGWQAAYYGLGALAMGSLLAVSVVFKPRPPPTEQHRPAFWSAHLEALKTPMALKRLSASYLWLGWVAGFGAIAAEVCARKLALTPTEAGLLMGWFGIVIVIGNVVSTPWQKLAGNAALPVAALSASLGMLAFVLPLDTMLALGIAGVPWALGYGAAGPLHHGRLSNLSTRSRGTINSYHASLLNLGIFSVSLLMGSMASGATNPMFCVVVAFVATCGTWPLLGDLTRQRTPPATPDASMKAKELDRT